MTPLAMVAQVTRRGASPHGAGARRWLATPVARLALGALAAGELWGDKLSVAPDRTVPPGLAARALTAGLAGAALAPRGRARQGALLAATTAVGSSYVTLAIRRRAMARFGQTRSGLVEDALVLGLSVLIVRSA